MAHLIFFITAQTKIEMQNWIPEVDLLNINIKLPFLRKY